MFPGKRVNAIKREGGKSLTCRAGQSLGFCLWSSAVRARYTDDTGHLSRATAFGIKKFGYLKTDAEVV